MDRYDENSCGLSDMNDIVVLDLINQGQLFSIYKARRNTKFVIIKVGRYADSMSESMLRREYEISMTLSHPFLVTPISFEENTPLGPAIVLEYIDGMTLDIYLETCEDKRKRWTLFSQLLDGVEYLHQKGVLHNDLKPQNILVTSHDVVKILDFGLSASNDSAYGGCISGSLGYTAPEVLDGSGNASRASDVYSLGCILSDLFPSSYRRIARKCIEANPKMRYQSAEALRNALKRARSLPFIVPSVVALALLIVLIFSPYADKAIEDAKVKKEVDTYTDMLESPYRKALQKATEEEYLEFASIGKHEYTYYVYNMMNEIPESEQLSFQTVMAGHISVLDSICMSKPSLTEIEDKVLQTKLLEEFSKVSLDLGNDYLK